jgi:hypothetical protein
MLLAALGWALVGGLLVGAIATFWDEIKDWLNNVAADFVEKHLGYNARTKMQKAISTADKVMNKIRNTSVVYTKKDRLDNYYDKTTIVGEEEVYEVKQEVLDKIKKEGSIVQEFKYMQ